MEPFDALWLGAAIRLASPLLLAAMGELVAERAGVLNLGLEGMMLTGAFFGFYFAWVTGSLFAGTVLATLAGVVLGGVTAVLVVTLRADQIVTGVGINLLALGVTTYLFRAIFADQGEVLLGQMLPVEVPGLVLLPVLGEPLFRQIPFVYAAYVIAAITWFLLYRLRFGLAVRAAGDVPAAADTAGLSVAGTRWIGQLIAGGAAGLAGAMLSVGSVGLFREGMSSGRGFLALAAVIFGRWRPLGVLGACLVFGAADALQLRLQSEAAIPASVWVMLAGAGALWIAGSAWQRHDLPPPLTLACAGAVLVLAVAALVTGAELTLPSQLWRTLPFVATLAALAGIASRADAPLALTIPYRRLGEA